MRTPGHDFELAAGFLWAEGSLSEAPTKVGYGPVGSNAAAEFNSVTVVADPGNDACGVPMTRLGLMSSSCGIRGARQIESLTKRLEPFATRSAGAEDAGSREDPDRTTSGLSDLLAGTQATLHRSQGLFGLTGGSHAAAAVDRTGSVAVVREDIGRHNAVDKVAGAMLFDATLPALDSRVDPHALDPLAHDPRAPDPLSDDPLSDDPLSNDPLSDGMAPWTLWVSGRAGRTMGTPVKRLGLHPQLWAGLAPNGIGRQKPHHYRDMLRIAREQLPHGRRAWEILSKGVCDGCALGVAGFHDWTLEGVHLCTTRLELLELNTMGPADHGALGDVGSLRRLDSTALRGLGRLAHPMRRRRGEPGFTRISWEEALGVLAEAIGRTRPERVALYLTSRGLTNETYYVAGKAARAIGTPNIDSAARVCHAPSTVGLKQAIGVAASTCSLRDVLESDLIVLWGTNPANNQPVFTKYLHEAKVNGAQVVVINPFLEPGLDNYWVPSTLESAVFGTRICDLHVPVRVGGDIAFAVAALKSLDERGGFDESFVAEHTEGVDELRTQLRAMDIDELLSEAGVDRVTLDSFVDLYEAAGGSVFVWSMGITHHTFGVDCVRAIVNLAVARGNVGRNGAGLMPIRGHSGVQGGAEMGAYATALPGGAAVDEANAAALSQQWGFDVPAAPGLTATEMVEAAGRGDLDVLWSSGGNFLDVLPDPPAVRAALERVPLRIHQDIVVSSQMLLDGDDVVLLPVATRYEQEGGGTSTTTERRVAFSPELPRQVGEARSEWRLFAEVASRVRPELAAVFDWPTNRDLRSEIASVVPAYSGIEHLERTGDAIQWGGRHLCSDGRFPTPSGRASFSVVEVPGTQVPEGWFRVTTRRGKQFNSMLWSSTDPLTGADRDAVYLDHRDAEALGVVEGDRVKLTSETGELIARVHLARLPARNGQVHWPEGNVLLPPGPAHREPSAGIPDYQSLVRIEPARVEPF